MLAAQIKDYMNQVGEEGIRVNADTVITVTDVEKTISVSPKKYKEKVKDLLIAKGIYSKNLEQEILNVKIDKQVQDQKIKMKKNRL